MTISSQVRTAGPFLGNGVATGGPFSFKVFNATDLVGVETSDLGVDRTLVYGTDFNVTLNPDQNASPGGTINYLIAGVGPSLIPLNYNLNFTSAIANLQPVALTNAGGFFPKVINDALDRLTILVQQLVRGVNASLKFPLSDGTGISSELPNKATRLAKVLGFDPVTGAPVVSTQTLAQIESGSTSAAASAVLASQWAALTTGIVDTTDYSAKAWAIGGTGVTNTATRGSSKDWASLTTGTVDTAEYSAKAYALGGTGITGVAGKGSAKDWATNVAGAVDTTEYSAKAYAIGGTGVTNTAGKGAAKEWAVKTSGLIDTVDYSAKEYAQGTQASTGGSAKNWAQQTGAFVTGQASEYSAKEYAQGSLAAVGGSSKNWAQQTGSFVTATSMSAKDWAVGVFNRGSAGYGSAKDWAMYIGGTVDGTNFSAAQYALNASNSASAINFRYCGTAGGTANALTVTPGQALTSHTGAHLWLIINTANTTEAVTINPSAVGIQNIKQNARGVKTNPAIGQFQPGMLVELQYDGTDYVIVNASYDLKAADIATAATVAIGAAAVCGNWANLTGVATVSAMSGLPVGDRFLIRHTGIHQLTHSATFFLLNAAANITTAVGDWSEWTSDGTNVYMTRYMRANGQPLVAPTNIPLTSLATQAARTVLANATNGTASPTAVAIAAARLFGSNSGGTALSDITLGTNLSMSGTTLNAAGAGWNLVTTKVLASDTNYSIPTNTGAFGYWISISKLAPSAAGNTLRMRGDYGSGVVTTATYDQSGIGRDQSGNPVTPELTDTSWSLYGNDVVDASGNNHLDIFVFDPARTGVMVPVFWGGNWTQNGTARCRTMRDGSGRNNTATTALAALNVFMSAGNLGTGTITIRTLT